ncbi:hypothetical protein [Pseudoalteromonas luteoviolacea]|uniref:Uncharacterized protein n=1 Tax=Pseudoalteromonas luteoviolacea S4054 TaxID=1129367 RepID=A0A0F6AI48_9GAMM|nr:hypothetical protein [Pseudoalteromonas luteoviolacea]AOT08750.1 hypothetical protein S4054249_13200 [Pseudoalteromonas luteoviolacea]AOT13664.1 hypothetical protein S40542_13170 [Pseudoalteromonas luteoviolacea]AOT18578.1 hypothetical protein S4054_13175 [Pseudoalteromonas luteoviolacea]KKE85456.1 hypothetical protein N479_26020 [Pseudoalteromonas luteoviolacea S4054]KZN64944.1 hypothetical protein N481_25260 [Pseudoalteromonas luteoviolacea S4047-1]
MNWKIIEEVPREFADESYSLKAECDCTEGTIVLEIVWAQIMYALTADLIRINEEPELIYDCMVFCEDRIEKYGHQVMRITDKSPFSTLLRLSSMQKDGVLNHYLSERYGVTFRTELPRQVNT